MPDTPLPLNGIRVIEFSHTVMGPSCGVTLADLGADVVKVEPPEGEPTRRSAGFASTSYSRGMPCGKEAFPSFP